MSVLARMPPLAASALGLLLDGDDQVLQILRTQLNMARAGMVEYSGSGFFLEFELPHEVPSVPGESTFSFGDVVAQVEGWENGAGFVVFVRAGRLHMLEGYSFEEKWPPDLPRYSVQYVGGGVRDLRALREAWADK